MSEKFTPQNYLISNSTKTQTELGLLNQKADYSRLQKSLYDFIINRKLASGAVVVFGTKRNFQIVCEGFQQEINDNECEKLIPIKEDSIFDLASITKIFTCLSILKLVDEGKVRLHDKIKSIDDRFVNLSEVTIEQLLSFAVKLETKKRIDMVENAEQAETLLFNIIPQKYSKGERVYTDMGAMVLKYVVETVSGKQFYKFVKDNILDVCKMNDTFVELNEKDRARMVSNNFERRIIGNDFIVDKEIFIGNINDKKARKLNKSKRQLHGHAGMFSTAIDMAKLVQGLLNGKIVDKRWLKVIGINRTGKQLPNGEYSQYHGYLCYSKNPKEYESEVSHWLSDSSFALGGFTGGIIQIDPVNEVFVCMLSNRCHNRVTNIDDISGQVAWNDGKKYICNKRFAYERGYVVEEAVKLALQNRMLEQLQGEEKNS